MFSLNDEEWSALSDTYGPASDIPRLLQHAEVLPEDLGQNAEPYFSLWSALCHQGDVYPASYAALPHLVRIVAESSTRFRCTLLSLAQAIEAARLQGRGPPIAINLRDATMWDLVEFLPSLQV
jgi:hypothetical protein